ncbi:uncharacterized protein BX663DRAFT_460101 [Cokeromyces recurvatus]|uniref:uncharacterized protein n=1 Tax=Cokeromyces recurvatus TaxID=90255 RepID=UPI00221E3826|nr:uncharacterized protein BX663DRAFT_460101 [Cokeromyces recurvatus]KAI7899473.1 hypothetical protein BX663DRAFT_460101 [Cokeromyces recurvatus]
MARKGVNTKVEAANNRKAQAKAEKDKAKRAELEALEDAKWSKGAKKNDKKEAEAAKKAAALQRKLEAQKQLAEEEKALNKPKAPKPNYMKKTSIYTTERTTAKKSNIPTSLTNEEEQQSQATKPILTEKDIEKHPERRFKNALKAFEERELKNFRAQYPGLRLSQLKEIMYKEFQKSPENPFNQSNVYSYNTSLEEINRKLRGEPEPAEEEEENDEEENEESSDKKTEEETSAAQVTANKKAGTSY